MRRILIGLVMVAVMTPGCAISRRVDELNARVENLERESARWREESQAWRRLLEEVLAETRTSKQEMCSKIDELKRWIDSLQVEGTVKVEMKSKLEEKCKEK